jgi:hypothetical protein
MNNVNNVGVSSDAEPKAAPNRADASSVAALVAVLNDALRSLADSGRSDQANRLAGRAYMALRIDHPDEAQRINVLMHRLVRIPDTTKE